MMLSSGVLHEASDENERSVYMCICNLTFSAHEYTLVCGMAWHPYQGEYTTLHI